MYILFHKFIVESVIIFHLIIGYFDTKFYELIWAFKILRNINHLNENHKIHPSLLGYLKKTCLSSPKMSNFYFYISAWITTKTRIKNCNKCIFLTSIKKTFKWPNLLAQNFTACCNWNWFRDPDVLLVDGVEEEKSVADCEQICQAFCDQMPDRRTWWATVLLLLCRKLLLLLLSGLLLLNESDQLTHQIFLTLPDARHVFAPLLLESNQCLRWLFQKLRVCSTKLI